jgi:hypothetical protein
MDEESKTEMTWTVRQSDLDSKKLSILKVIYIAVVVFVIFLGFVTKSLVLPVLFLVVVFASTYEFFGGRKFLLNERVARSGPSEMTWSAVKSVHVRETEVYLSPFTGESKLDAFRGVKLNTRNVSKENVLEFIREHVGKDVQFLGE